MIQIDCMHLAPAACLLAAFALAGCAEGPPEPGSVTASRPPPPPLSAKMANVTASSSHQAPGNPKCTDYSVTGTLSGAVRTVTGQSCRLPDGSTQVQERSPLDGKLIATTYPPPSMIDYADETEYEASDASYDDAYYYGPYGWDGYYGYPVIIGGFGYGYGHRYGDRFYGDRFHGGGFHGGGFRGGGGFHGGGGHGR